MTLPTLLYVILALHFALNLFSALIGQVCHAVVHIDKSYLIVYSDINLEVAKTTSIAHNACITLF